MNDAELSEFLDRQELNIKKPGLPEEFKRVRTKFRECRKVGSEFANERALSAGYSIAIERGEEFQAALLGWDEVSGKRPSPAEARKKAIEKANEMRNKNLMISAHAMSKKIAPVVGRSESQVFAILSEEGFTRPYSSRRRPAI